MPARYDSYDGADDAARREQHRLPARELAAPPYTQPARYRPPSTVTQDERATLGPDDSASQLESSHGGRSYQGPRATSSYDPYAPHVPQQRPVSYSSGRQDSQSVEYYGHSERDGPFSRAPELEEYRDGRHELGEAYGASSSALPLVSGAAAPAGHRDSRYDYEHDGIEGQGYYDPPGEGKVHYSDGPEAEDDRDAIKADEETVTYPPVSTKGLHQERQAQEPSNWRHLFYDSRPIASRIHDHQRGIGVQKYGIACYVLAVVMSCVMIWELVRMNQRMFALSISTLTCAETGSPIQTRPIFNVMIGPSAVSLINDGARFSGCMKFIPGVSDISWVCVNSSNSATVTAAAASCTMADICGFSGFPPAAPNQSFRFVLPIFLHAGVIHLALNMLVMCLLSAAIERQMGTPRFLLLFIPAGIFGFVLGGNFALVGQPSVGASGAVRLPPRKPRADSPLRSSRRKELSLSTSSRTGRSNTAPSGVYSFSDWR